jgi:hypothetical protein
MPRRTSFVKHLRLVMPEAASSQGLPATDAPVFISPQIDVPQRCPACGVTYTALVYQTGYPTQSQHWHEREGGIYFFVTDHLPSLLALTQSTGWLAAVIPLGKTMSHSSDGASRAEAVRVTAIAAWCSTRELDGHEYPGRLHRPHRLDKGLLYAYPGYRHDGDLLLPVCGPDEIDVEDAPLRFIVRDGVVAFSMR